MADFWFSRLSPAGRVVGGRHAVTLLGGAVIAPNAQAPQWADEHTIYYTRESTGMLYRAVERENGSWSETLITTHGVNLFTVTPSAWAASWITDGQAVTLWPGLVSQVGVSSPALSPSGQRAYLEYGTGRLFVNDVLTDNRQCLEPRFTGEILAWRADDGHDVCVRFANGAVENRLNVESREYWPIAFTGPDGTPWLLTHSDTRLLLRPVGSLTGYIVSVGITSYPDAHFLDGSTVKLVWTDNAGNLTVAHVNTAAPRVDLRPGAEPPDPPEPTVNPPGVNFSTTFPQQLSHTRTTVIRVTDRNNAGTATEVEFVPSGQDWSVHVRLTNPAGTDRSGTPRILQAP